MADYERIPYSSFVWKFGTTSFRTKEFNKMTEWQLRLLDEFWKKPEFCWQGWEIAAEGQNGIYEIKNCYYDWLVENGFTKGDEKVKYKAAREKTSGLYDMGLIDNEHRLTEVGKRLLSLASGEDLKGKTKLGISLDSELYLSQLIKLYDKNTGHVVRPFIVFLYLLTELDYMSYDEFRYLLPLCTDDFSTEYILHCIRELRSGSGDIDGIIKNFLLSKVNYRTGLMRFVDNPFSEELLLSVGMNRKSVNYDKPYVALYENMHAVYMEHDSSRIVSLFESTLAFQGSIGLKWKTMMFDTGRIAAIKVDPESHLIQLPTLATQSEEEFKKFFYLTMHLNKAKATLEDYLDLNRRYLSLTNCFLFADSQVKLDIVPKQLFKAAIPELYKQAYSASENLFVNTSLEEICPLLAFDEKVIIDGLNKELGTSISTIDEAYDEVDRIRYSRFNALIDEKFTDDDLLRLLSQFESRSDSEINSHITDNADIPTIFEYVLGIIWYKASERRGKVLDYLKLSLDADLLPITHAAGGEADIVYEYKQTPYYPAHSVLLEATLAEKNNQRRMEMEPVSRHVGNHILRTGDDTSYGIFATTDLNVNVISDFKSRKHTPFFDMQDETRFIPGMKIIPLDTDCLKSIVSTKVKYKDLYHRFELAYQKSDYIPNPRVWYDECVKL